MAETTSDTRQLMQRVRVGMTGLLTVTVLIVAAGAIYNSAREEPRSGAIGAPNPDVVATITAESGTLEPDLAKEDEPLAELGVAPSTKSDEAVANEQSGAAAPPAQ